MGVVNPREEFNYPRSLSLPKQTFLREKTYEDSNHSEENKYPTNNIGIIYRYLFS
jgi:hypothetical protein